ncbi:MAG: 6-phosphogluconolactonase [Chitinophagaceae bacterium]
MKLIIKSRDELAQQLARWLADHINQKLKQQDSFTFLLAGGNTPKKLYRLLAAAPLKNEINWNRIHFFWGDERYVPFNDEDNNARMVFDNLLTHVPVIKENVHIIRTDIPAEESASAYETLLHHYFPDKNKTFDLVLLGIGDNAHTLSLFPGYDQVNEKEKWVCSFYLEEQKMIRITLTAPVINAAACVIFLVEGTNKAGAVFQILEEAHNPDLYPAQIIQPYRSELQWWIDEGAATDLS